MGDQKQLNSLTTPVEKEPLVFLVLERIKDALINNELRPGDYLPSETELAKNLGVGKSSVREAIKMLQAMGAVEVRRGHGTIIREQAGDDFINSMIFQLILENGLTKNMLDLRIMFEPAYSIVAMERATEEDIERIKQAIKRLETAIKNGSPEAEDDIAFHKAILQSTHNSLVIKIGETILQLFKPSISTSMKTIPEIALRDHRRIFKAFCEKNEEKLRKAILKSFEGWKKSLYRN